MCTIISPPRITSYSLFSYGIEPFIISYLIIYLLKSKLPSLNRLSNMGINGQGKLMLYALYLSLGIIIIQSSSTILRLDSYMMEKLDLLTRVRILLSLNITRIAGSFFLVWLALKLNDKGLGNGFLFILAIEKLSKVVYNTFVECYVFWSLEIFYFLALFLGLFSLTIFLLLILQHLCLKNIYKSNSSKANQENAINPNINFIDLANPKEVIIIFGIFNLLAFISHFLFWLIDFINSENLPQIVIIIINTLNYGSPIYFLLNIIIVIICFKAYIIRRQHCNISISLKQKAINHFTIIILGLVTIIPLIILIISKIISNHNFLLWNLYLNIGEGSRLFILVALVLTIVKDLKKHVKYSTTKG